MKFNVVGQYIHFKSFAPISHKSGLVRTLFDRPRKLCSVYMIDKEFVKLHEIPKHDVHLTCFIPMYILCINQINNHKNVYINLPYIEDGITTLIKRRLNSVIIRTYNTANLVFVEKTDSLPHPQWKDKVACFDNSLCVYLFLVLVDAST